MNEKQAKRLRWARRRYVAENKTKMDAGPSAQRAADLLAGVVIDSWHRFNHRTKGRVMRHIARSGL